MADIIEKILSRMRESPRNVRFDDLCKVCGQYFGTPRQKGSSHRIYKMPWTGDPRIKLQKGNNGLAKAYQIKQVLAAIDRLEKEHEPA